MQGAINFNEERKLLEQESRKQRKENESDYESQCTAVQASVDEIRAKLDRAGVSAEQASEWQSLISQKNRKVRSLRLECDLKDVALWLECELKDLDKQYEEQYEMLEQKRRAERIHEEMYETKRKRLESEEEDERQALELRGKKKRRALEVDEADEREREKERMKPGTVTDDPAMSAFIEGVRNMQLAEEDVVFSLPSGVCLGGQSRLKFLEGKLYIRDCYRRLRDLILEAVAEKEEKKRTRSFVIQGNPGIGKSLFSYFMIYTLLKEGKTIIWEPAKTEMRICIKFGLPPQVVEGHRGFFGELRDESTWFIVDGHEPQAVNAYTLLVCSPKKDHWSEIKKRGAMMLFMPVWTWPELEAAFNLELAFARPQTDLAHQPKRELTLVTMREVFDEWGGIPRAVIEQNLDKAGLDHDLTAAINTVEIKDLDSVLGLAENSEKHSHRLLHMHVETRFGPEFTPFSYPESRFASNYVGLRVTEKLLERQRADTLKFAMINHGALYGSMFEGIAHNLLSTGGTFRVRKLQQKAGKGGGVSQGNGQKEDERNVTFAKRTVKPFSVLTEVTSESGLYWKPKVTNLESIDSLEFPDKLFQMTVSKNHPVKMNGLENALAAMHKLQPEVSPAKKRKQVADDQPARLYFVVPTEIFESYQWQNYTTQKDTDATRIPDAVKRLEQYALEVCITVPVDPSATKSASEQSSKA